MSRKRQHGHAVGPSGPYEKHSMPNYVPEFKTPQQFVEKKIEMLEKDFHIMLSLDDRVHLRSLKTERAINAAVRGIIDRAWR